MAMTANGLTPCPGGDCHGIDHAWCAPGKHVGKPRPVSMGGYRAHTVGGRHRRDVPPIHTHKSACTCFTVYHSIIPPPPCPVH